jgi:hypothetical protein
MKNLELYESFGPNGGMPIGERIELLMEAQQKLSETVDLIEQALKGTSHERHADAYIIGHLNNWIDGSGYDMGIQQYMDKLQEESEYEEEEEDYEG